MKVSILKQPFKGFKLQNHIISHNFSPHFTGSNPAEGEGPLTKPLTSNFSLEDSRKLLRKAQMLQNLIKMQSLINDSLSKINALLKNVGDRREILLLSQIANNLLKVQTKIEQLQRYMEKTPLNCSNGGNF
jgi:hypothetical protein